MPQKETTEERVAQILATSSFLLEDNQHADIVALADLMRSRALHWAALSKHLQEEADSSLVESRRMHGLADRLREAAEHLSQQREALKVQD